MNSLKNKVYIVTGGAGTSAGKSGAWISRKLSEQGASVAIWDIADKAGEQLSAELSSNTGNVLYVHCDVCIENDVKKAVETTLRHFGHIDGLVNNAFWHAEEQPPLHTLTLEEWDKHIDINLRCHFIVCKYVIPSLLKQKQSVIVNIGSTGSKRGEDGYSAYSAAKAGLESLTRSIAAQYGRQGLRCNILVPGLTLAPDMDTFIETVPALKETFHQIDKHNLLLEGHGNGSYVADAVLFLLSDKSKFMTAQSIVLDGGTISHFPQWADMRTSNQS